MLPLCARLQRVECEERLSDSRSVLALTRNHLEAVCGVGAVCSPAHHRVRQRIHHLQQGGHF